MKEYNIIYQSTPDWTKVPKLDVDVANWMPNPGISVKAQIAWNEDGLYYHGTAIEKEIRAVHNSQVCDVCEDSCLEFFFMPEEDTRYINIEANLNCATWIGIGTNMPDRVRLLLQNEKELLDIHANRLPDGDGWELFYKVPIELIRMFYPGYELKEGNVIRANCMKCGDLTVNEHYLSWNPFNPDKLSFHEQDYFGRMILTR